MKFVKQGQRNRQWKGSALCAEQENIPPTAKQQNCKEDIPPQLNSMQAESVEPYRKEEDVYFNEIVNFLSQFKHSITVRPDFFKQQPDISEHMRGVLLNWLIDVHLKYKLQNETLFITIHIIDAYLSTALVNRTKLQLVGIAALWIASKYEETYQVPKINNLVFICDSAYTKEQILEMESNIIETLDFNILFVTELHYFQTINQISSFETKDYFLCRYILEMCMFDVYFKKYHPKLIASGVAYFVRKLRKHGVCWSIEQQQLLEVSEAQTKECAREICLFWQQAQEVQTLNSLRNKYLSPDYKEVSKIKINHATKPPPIAPRGLLRA